MKTKIKKFKKAPPKIDLGDPIHIRLEYTDAVKSKKDILLTEMNLLKILRIMKNYHSLRTEELDAKINLYKKVMELRANFKKIEDVFPKIKIPNILNKGNIFETTNIEEKSDIQGRIKNSRVEERNKDIDYQLREIQEKLKALSR
ncbi:MAG: hypothetical protein AABX88_00535 [Nanoarchaeota archaeon]